MGEYKDITLDRDRAFDINSLNELLTQGKSILNEAIRISQKMETSISTISGIYSGIDGEYKVGALGSDIASLSGTLKKDIYQDTIDRMDKILNKLINDMPSYDNSLAQSMSGIQEVLGSVKGRISELRGLLETGDFNLSYTEFSRRLKDLKVGWDETTEDLSELLAEIENDMLGVFVTAVRYSSDPVNLSTGNFVYDHEDIKINGEIPLSFHRYYNSKDRTKGSMGRCFIHNYESHLEENTEKEKIIISMGDGQKKTFRKIENGTYQSLHSATETLAKEKDNYILTKLTGERIIYNEAGQMIRQENRYGRGITFSYYEMGKLEKAETDNHTSLTYSYNEAGQLILVTDHTERSVELSYERGKLAAVKNPLGNTYAYHYGKNGRIEETVNSRGYIAVKNTYDERRRITRQEFPDGGHMEYAYDDSKRQVILTERNGSRITYIHDSKYRNTDILYEDGTKEHFEYNGKNQRILHVDRNGNSTRMAYDNRGNLTQIVNALGEKTNMTYNADNQLAILKVNGKEKLRNGYDKKGNLISSIGADGKGNQITYDEQGRPICIENADKSTTKITYDDRGNIGKICDENGVEISYEYDSLNRVYRTIDGNGNSTLFEFDGNDRIIKVTNSLGDSRSYDYNESGKITRVTDYDGFNVQLEYNSLNKPQTIIDKEGNLTHFYYDRMWNISELQQANGGVYRYEYDAANRLKEKHFPEGGYVSYTYDGNGNCISETDAEGNKRSFIYDALNRMTGIQEPDGTWKHYKYDSEGNLESIMDTLGNCIRYTYDEMGRQTSKTDVLGNITVIEYTSTGKIEKIIYPNGTTDKYVYQNGLLKNAYKADGNSLQYKYDGNGNIISIIDGMGKESQYIYDALNRVVSEITAEGNKTFQYDSIGNLKQFIDENGNTTDYEYSPNGNLRKVTDALGNETNYFYDCMGNLVKTEKIGKKQDLIGQDKVVGNNNQTSIYEWNLDGQIIKVIDPAGDVEHYAYDKSGRMTKKWDRENLCTIFHYGNTGDLTEILYGDGRSVLLSYDALHHLESIKDWNGTTKIISDALGRTLSVIEPDGRTVSYEWGSKNEKRVLNYPNGKKAEYSYNNRGLLERLTTEEGSIKYEYDAMGRLSKKELPNGIVTSYTYNEMGRIQQICHNGKNFSEIYKYYYDAVGNKIRIEKNRDKMKADDGSFSYNYDALNRLIQVTRNGKLLRKYDYDAFGNRIIKKEYEDETERIIQYRYNEKNQLIAEIDNGLERNYRYDQCGNMTEVSIGEKMIRQFTFDATNQMSSSVEVVDNLIKKAEYRYNGLGQRIGQDIWRIKEGSVDAVKILADDSIQDKPEEKIRYTIDLTKRYRNILCMETNDKKQTFYWDDNIIAMEECGIENYYIQDDLGSPMHLMDNNGKSREIYSYDEFGIPFYQKLEQSGVENRIITSKDIFQGPLQPFGFTGYQMDEVGGLYFAQARRYDASLGRFISEDFFKGFIAAPFTLNHYGYCWNRPLDLVDLDGQIPTWLKVVGAVAAVAVVATIAVVAAPAAAAAVVVTATAAGAAVGGVVGGVTNVATGSGSFINGFAGGAVNGAISVGFAFSLSPYASNAVGGAAGSYITDALNNSDKPEEEQKSLEEINWSAFIAGVTQSLVGGSLGELWGSATGGWNIANTTGASMIATALWDTLFAGGIAFSTGTIASIVSSESWKAFLESIGLSDDNSVKE